MMKRIVKIFACVLLISGIIVLVYPVGQHWLFDRKNCCIIDGFDRWRQEETEKETSYLPELYEAMQEYNRNLYESGQSGFRDAWSYQVPSFDLTKWGIENNMVGYIDIPPMNVKLPIYLGASTENMLKGAVHLSQTSLPIGEINSNSVIAGHRGYSTGRLFRDIELLKIGDDITITNLWETMTYRVVETRIIQPNDTDAVLIQEGRDLVTIITCHPYRLNYQRYVVYCERVKWQ